MDGIITVFDGNGNKFEVEVLDIFNVEGYDHEYILYTKNEEVDADNVKTYVSILKSDNDEYSILNIDDEKEWDTVQRAVLEMGNLNE